MNAFLLHKRATLSSSICKGKDHRTCIEFAGQRGVNGDDGGKGGNAGRPGDGGNAGSISIRSRKITGRVQINSCQGSGAKPAKNGRGGRGGAGGKGGLGARCRMAGVYEDSGLKRGFVRKCMYMGVYPRAASGEPGKDGAPGTTSSSPGKDGALSASDAQSGTLDPESKKAFPLDLLKLMRRQAEDMLLGNNNDQKGRDALQFMLTLTNERNDVDDIKKDVRRKIGFLDKSGYDIFGKNELFAPRMKWEALQEIVENIKTAAKIYEEDFNGVVSTLKSKENIEQMASKISSVTKEQVKNEEDRLVGAKESAEKEKRLYVKSIQQLEQQLSSTLQKLKKMLRDVHKKVEKKLNEESLLAMIQGIIAFSGAVLSKDPLAVISTNVDIFTEQSNQPCMGSLQSSVDKIEKWMTFGNKYKPLIDSGDLDLDQMDVASVPEIMKANLDMNKEKLAADLVCLLDVDSKPEDIAEFKQVMESFFITGAARIDLIAKVMDLDNDIGGYSFDIDLLKETQNAIEDIGRAKDAKISRRLQRMYLESLLSTYRELQRSFLTNVYELDKAFEFRSLWQERNPLSSFERVASESALGAERLSGVVHLTGVLQNVKSLEIKAMKCFTDNIYSTGIKRWEFSKEKDKEMFEELLQGNTKFSLNIDKSCDKCYNIRLVKIYIELFGTSTQPANVPDDVHLKIRHLSGSYFRAGDDTIKQYRQSVGSYRKIKFDRFTLTDKKTCRRRKKKGSETKCITACLTEKDSRWHPMCNHPLNGGGLNHQDKLLGMEECKSPFGIYELEIPVDKNLACEDSGMKNANCKDLKLKRFTQMNVWTYYFYWSGQYPTGPDDPICKGPGNQRDETADIVQHFSEARHDLL